MQHFLDPRREDDRIAVVEDLRDLLAIEGTGHWGRYHVLSGVISPMDGVGPADLRGIADSTGFERDV